MYRIFILMFISILSCKKEVSLKPRLINSVEIETILRDSLLSIRAIELLNDGSLAFAANNGAFGLYNVNTKKWMLSKQTHDRLDLHFRAVGHTSSDFFMLSIENPALLYKTGEDGNMKLTYKEKHPKVFYDAMSFWNDQEGIAIGDPTDDCMSIIITRNGGNTWSKMPCGKLPKVKSGEAAFAASNSNIAIVGNRTWIATGGMSSRILHSPDKGETWQVYNTPMVQGTPTTGMYSIDFYDELNGFTIGGDYTKPENNMSNKMKTVDGGKNWIVVADGKSPGYRSCVQYVPNRKAKELVAVGFKGIDFSSDAGNTWRHLSNEGFYTVRFLNDSIAYAAGQGRISKLIFKE
ncbi:WD40/YVTN/BNR-like repeat-containing protein [Changchengzhania lutea]|uniref:WD40/YVTN/BNR-like repeat-containing protein n=1 Tax=Changchengzhania lutea TaxID=2049305 RepID=UPI00115D6F41|nr:oxidoreductase [Changchengzhania lutea]